MNPIRITTSPVQPRGFFIYASRQPLPMNKAWHYTHVLQTLLTNRENSAPIKAVIEAILQHGLNRGAVQTALQPFGNADLSQYKDALLDTLLSYAGIILDDHAISDGEFADFGLLKVLFEIKEGDFYGSRPRQLRAVINHQMDYFTVDGKITADESFTTANIQGMFDLTSEQFFALWDNAPPSVKVSK